MKEYSYNTIKEALGGKVYSIGLADGGDLYELIYRKDIDAYELRHIEKFTDNGAYVISHLYHKDGTVEEVFDFCEACELEQ